MKKIITALTAVVLTMGFSAQAQNEQQQNPQMQECSLKEGKQTPRDCAFEGLNLTDAQKEQLKAVAKKHAESKKDKTAKKEARKEATRTYLAEIKAILTPEQYVQFLENSFVNKGKAMTPRKAHRPSRQDRPMRQAPEQKADVTLNGK